MSNPEFGHTPGVNRKGRPKGTPNKVTTRIRDAFALLVEANLENMTTWLAIVAENDPLAALKVIIDLAEYTTPKLARQELTHSASECTAVEFKVTAPTAPKHFDEPSEGGDAD